MHSHFHTGAFEIQGQRNQRIFPLLYQTEQAVDLRFVHQKLTLPQRIAVKDVAMLIRADMHLFDNQLAILDAAPAIL